MPHLVANFLRTSSGNISHIKKSAISRSRTTSRNNSRNNSFSASPYASDSEDHACASHSVKMPDLADAMKKHRLSLHFGRSSNAPSSSSSPSSSSPHAPVAMDWSIESPPIVFYGSPAESTGALVSGLLYIDVNEDAVEVDSFTASLSIHATQKKPFQSHCPDCHTKVTDLRSWQFLAHPTSLRRGRHQFPFSTLLDGSLPASMDSPLVSFSYQFKAEAVAVRAPSPAPAASASAASSTSASRLPVRFERTLRVKRSLPEPLYPHHSVRVFPPTNIKASAHYTAVIHPSGSNSVTLKLDGLMTHNEKVKTVDLWKLKKVTWKLEETIKTTASPCDRHAPASSADDPSDPGRAGLVRTETRLLGEKQLHDGWKSDYSGNDGTVDLEFDYTVNQLRAHGKEPRYACDLRAHDGTDVSHALHIELIVSKEFAPEGKTHLATQTGTGRILRMHFAVNLTEYPGLGVSWDNEAPPVYQDVPPSPPGYPAEPPIEYDDLEELDALRAVSAPGSRRHSESGRST
ncbi:arrestin (or S-antigen) [Metarhizium album ARSEF 1941]|uniref:Arrestin (Or S-antigen) n=1 Tax=Metarhizium album (strain ARSEF 1941) TaxID=1081103 RepID=A0A0B2WU41_METAS|nr:arrestin (or S-antigen) [Metarhizium album ARSEF 1941]KHN97583.1 arrestin (or S-antigen) [Metarhizium album ARSEF 1941]